MHTHSEYSHDSQCKIEDMCLAQIERGAAAFAVTDHCDIALPNLDNHFKAIQQSCLNAKRLNDKYGDKIKILSGVEIGELFWYPQYREKFYSLYPYDVVIGSVHQVKDRYTDIPYSKIDFGSYSADDVYYFLDQYFNDLKSLLETTDFDILAHLTCPLRYIVGKYHMQVDMPRYDGVVGEILQTIIDKSIALEVNTSTYSMMQSFLPDLSIIKRYYDMGGRLITVGSDAHIAQNAAQHFDTATALLKEIGFDGIYYYQNRKPIKLSI